LPARSVCAVELRVIYLAQSRFDARMAPRFLTILTGHNLPKIRQPREPEPSIINEKTIADFTRVVEQMGILERERLADEAPDSPRSAPALPLFIRMHLHSGARF
jgi:hypothetical protein